MIDNPVISHSRVEMVPISKLKMHPKNAEIYGEENVTALAQSIDESKWVDPLTAKPDGTVVSGNRRLQATILLDYTELPVIFETFTSEEAEMERLLRANENRVKTPEQQIREGMLWEPIEEKKARERKGRLGQLSQSEIGRVREIIASRVGLGSGKTYERGKEVIEYLTTDIACTSERADIILMKLNDDKSIGGALDLVSKYQSRDTALKKQMEEKEEELLRQQELARQRYLEAVKKAEHCTLYHCSVVDLSHHVQPDSIDCIITDPPYPKEFLSVYSDLAEFASYALKPGGLMAVMVGQSYLEEVLRRLNSADGVDYRWTCAYFTPGPAPQLHHREIQSNWKPVLLYSKGEITKGRYIIDVFRSELNAVRTAKEEKLHHEWGQSEGGIADIMQRVTDENDLVCDPFVGGGSTARVAIDMKRRFIGCDVDEACVRSLEEMKAALIEQQVYEV